MTRKLKITADAYLGVREVNEGVAGGVQAVGGGAQGDGLPGTDLAGQDPEAARGDEPAEPGDSFFVGGGGIQRRDGDGGGEWHAGETVVLLQVRDHHRCLSAGFSAVGGGDGVGDQGDVALVEVAEAVAEADGDAGLDEAGGDFQDRLLGPGAGQVPGLQGVDSGVPPDDGQRLPGGDAAAGGDDAPEGGVAQEAAMPAAV